MWDKRQGPDLIQERVALRASVISSWKRLRTCKLLPNYRWLPNQLRLTGRQLPIKRQITVLVMVGVKISNLFFCLCHYF